MVPMTRRDKDMQTLYTQNKKIKLANQSKTEKRTKFCSTDYQITNTSEREQ